jgi:hypothetical protein
LEALLEHAPQHRAGDKRVHGHADHLPVTQPYGNRVRLEFEPTGQPFDDIASAKRVHLTCAKGQKQMLAGEQRVLSPARLVNGTVDDPSNCVADLA